MSNQLPLVIGGLIGLLGLAIGATISYRNLRQLRNLMSAQIQKAEQELNEEISKTSLEEFYLTPSGNELLQLRKMNFEDQNEITKLHKFQKNKKTAGAEIKSLEKTVFLSSLLKENHPASGDMKGVVGIESDTLMPFGINLKKDLVHLLVGGPPQSGRTKLIHTIVLSLSYNYSPAQLNIVLIDAPKTLGELAELPHVVDYVTEEDGLINNIAHLLAEISYRRKSQEDLENLPKILFIFDDYDLTCEASLINEVLLSKLGKLVQQDSDLGFHFLISAYPEYLTRSDPIISQIRLLSRAGISLGNSNTVKALGGRLRSARDEELLEGGGYFFSRSSTKQVQFAIPNRESYEMVLKKWESHEKAQWLRPSQQDQVTQLLTAKSPLQGNFINMDKAVEAYIKQQQLSNKK